MKYLLIVLIALLLCSCASAPCGIGSYGLEPETEKIKK